MPEFLVSQNIPLAGKTELQCYYVNNQIAEDILDCPENGITSQWMHGRQQRMQLKI